MAAAAAEDHDRIRGRDLAARRGPGCLRRRLGWCSAAPRGTRRPAPTATCVTGESRLRSLLTLLGLPTCSASCPQRRNQSPTKLRNCASAMKIDLSKGSKKVLHRTAMSTPSLLSPGRPKAAGAARPPGRAGVHGGESSAETQGVRRRSALAYSQSKKKLELSQRSMFQKLPIN